MINSSNQKQQQEEFVANLNGTTIFENYCLISMPILLNLCYSFWSINLFQLGCKSIKSNICLNFVFVVVPYIFCITIFNERLYTICGCVALLSVFGACNSIFLSKANRFCTQLRLSFHLSDKTRLSLLFVSQMRGIILLCTAICILAVDMKVFPRRFAKTETYGYGSMDLGVGLFTLMMGLVDNCSSFGDNCDGFMGNEDRIIALRKKKYGKMKSVLILMYLGLSRLAFVKLWNYQEHQSEYGVHWNFFFTIALVRLLSILIGELTRNIVLNIIMILLIVIGQYWLLIHYDWLSFCLDNSIQRIDYLIGNKEGIISLIGYFLLWLIGAFVANIIGRARSGQFVFVLMIFGGLLAPLVAYFIDLRVARRAANIEYVLWTSSSFCWCLALLIGGDMTNNLLEDRANLPTESDYPDVFSTINRRAMFHFLLANILTGLANKWFVMLELSLLKSMIILIIYTALPIIIIQYIASRPLAHNIKEE